MTSPSTAEQVYQVGTESTAGVAVAATTAISNGEIELTNAVTSDRVRVAGQYFPSAVFRKDERSSGTLTGIPCLANFATEAALIFGTPTTTDVEAGVVEKDTYTLSPTRPTLTVEKGDANSAERFTNVIATGFSLEWGWNSGDSKLTVDLAGLGYEPNVSLTPAGSVTTPEPAPIAAQSVRVFLDSTKGALGTTEIDLLSLSVSISDIAALIRYSASTDSVNTVPNGTITPKLRVGSLAHSLYNGMATNARYYLRIEITGAVIPGATNSDVETITFDFCVGVEGQERGDQDAVFAATCPMAILIDATGFSHEVTHTRAA